jgi:hypothetical protein
VKARGDAKFETVRLPIKAGAGSMQIDDLKRLPESHPPSPYNHPIPLRRDSEWGYGVLPEKLPILAVGWLGDSLPSEGDVEPKCIDQLWQANAEERTIIDGTMGWHNCELCDGEHSWYPDKKVGPVLDWRGEKARVRGYGHFLIRTAKNIYMAPVLILHYILDHGYKPPDDFIEAVIAGKCLSMDDLEFVKGG